MRIGRPNMYLVSTDSAGVPTGGKWGHVAQFEQDAKRHGLYVAWSRKFSRFVVYTINRPGDVIVQEVAMRRDNYAPVPLGRQYLAVLLFLKEQFARETEKTIGAKLNQFRADQKYKEAVRRQKEFEDMERPVMDRVRFRKRGPRPTIIVPRRLLKDIRKVRHG